MIWVRNYNFISETTRVTTAAPALSWAFPSFLEGPLEKNRKHVRFCISRHFCRYLHDLGAMGHRKIKKTHISPPFRLGLLDFKEKSGLSFSSRSSSALLLQLFFSSSSSDLLLQLSSAHLLQISFFSSPSSALLQLIFLRSPSSTLLSSSSSDLLLQLSFFSPPQLIFFSSPSSALLQPSFYGSYSADRPFRQLSPSNLATFMVLLFRRSTISAAFPSNLATFMELLFRGTISNDRNKVWVGIARSK